MAFKLNGGRGSFQKTGRGIPQTLMSGPPTRQLVDATTGKTAKELAQEKLNKQMEQAGKNTGDSKNVRTFEASATAKKPGQKVEKIAKTPAEIKKWKEAKEKAEKEGKPFGEQYKEKEETVTVKASDKGEDKMQPTKTDAAKTTPATREEKKEAQKAKIDAAKSTQKAKIDATLATREEKKTAQKANSDAVKAKLEERRNERQSKPKVDERSKEEIQEAIRKSNKGNKKSSYNSGGTSLMGAKIRDFTDSIFKGGCKTCK